MLTEVVNLAPDQSTVPLSTEDRAEALAAAYWVTASPHEWTWTPREQALMARYCLWAHQRLAAVKQLADGPLGRPPCSTA